MDVPSPIFETLWKEPTESTRPAPAASSFFVQSEQATDRSGDSVDDSTSKKSQEDQQEKTCPYAEL